MYATSAVFYSSFGRGMEWIARRALYLPYNPSISIIHALTNWVFYLVINSKVNLQMMHRSQESA